MPVENYERPFEVIGEPYDYGLADADYIKFSKSKSVKGSLHMELNNKAAVLNQGVVIFIFLAVLTALEFFVAIAIGAVVLLVVFGDR